MACQVVHYPHHSECVTEPAPEPRDVVWSSISMTQREGHVRQFLGMAVMVLLLLFWIRKSAYSGIAALISSARFVYRNAAVVPRNSEGFALVGTLDRQE